MHTIALGVVATVLGIGIVGTGGMMPWPALDGPMGGGVMGGAHGGMMGGCDGSGMGSTMPCNTTMGSHPPPCAGVHR